MRACVLLLTSDFCQTQQPTAYQEKCSGQYLTGSQSVTRKDR